MADVLAVGVYMADRPNTAAHLICELSASRKHNVTQRWVALAPGRRGRCDLPMTELVVSEPKSKFLLLDQLTEDRGKFDWILICDDDVEVGPDFVDQFIAIAERYDFALCQPARTSDSFIDHPIVQVLPGLTARQTRFVEIGPLVCLRCDAVPLLLPFGEEVGMGWGLDFVWPVRLENAGLRLGIIDATPIAHRIRPPGKFYDTTNAREAMNRLLSGDANLTRNEAFVVLEAYA